MNDPQLVEQADHGGDLEDFFENGTVGLHLVASDGTIIRANRADYEPLGYTAEEYIGQSITRFHADEDVIADILQRLTAGEKLDKYPARLVAKDGSLRHVLISSSVCFRDGGFVNTRCFTLDVTDKIRAEAALREAQERLTVTYENLLAGIAEVDASGRFLRVNEAFVKISGYEREELLTRSFFDITHPDDVEQERERYRAQVDGELAAYTLEKRYVRKDGRIIWVEVNGSTVRTEDGDFRYGVRMVQDVNDRKLAEEQKKLLLAELNHRVKNTLATVQALAAHTARNSSSPEDFQRRFEPRLLALSAAHDRLTNNDWRGTNLADIVAGELLAHRGTGPRVTAQGPDVLLLPRVSLALSMGLHELATNALKYGALSVPEGRVDVRWELGHDGEPSSPISLRINWTESGGPPVKKPESQGFGSRLLRVTAAELRGVVTVEWNRAGLIWELVFPLDQCNSELSD
jgi:PAS domain S-box-containing protein